MKGDGGVFVRLFSSAIDPSDLAEVRRIFSEDIKPVFESLPGCTSMELVLGMDRNAGGLVDAAALSRWRAGVQVDRPGRSWLLAGACAMAIAALLALSAGLSGPSDGVVLVACAMLGVGYGAVQCLTLVYSFARTASSERPVASAVWNCAFDAGTATGAVLIGALSATGIGWWGTFAVFAVLVAAVMPAAVSSPR